METLHRTDGDDQAGRTLDTGDEGDIIDITRMGQLIVRNVDDKLVRALKLRAAAHGRSAEAEHREILREALAPGRPGRTLKEALLSMPAVGDDADFERPRDTGRTIRL